MIVECGYCHRSYDSEMLAESCPHEPLAPYQARGLQVRHQVGYSNGAELLPAFGGPANGARLPVCGDVDTVLEVVVQVQPQLSGSAPVEMGRERYGLIESPGGDRFYRHVKEEPAGTRVSNGYARSTRSPPSKAAHVVQGEANRRRARQRKGRQ